jgi:hypothetical protein
MQEEVMFSARVIAGSIVVALMATLFSSSPALADHLDALRMRQVVRQVEEKNDVLQDRIADWAGEHHDHHDRHGDDLQREADHFDQNLAQFKLDLYHHQEPWDLRDNARNIIDTAADMGHVIEQNDWHGQFRHEWEDLRDSLNELARQFHLPEIGH